MAQKNINRHLATLTAFALTISPVLSCNLISNREDAVRVGQGANSGSLATSPHTFDSSGLAQTLREGTSFNRTHGAGTAVRLRALFPRASSSKDEIDTYFSDPERDLFDSTSKHSIASTLMSDERSVGTSGALALLTVITPLCMNSASNLFEEGARAPLESVWKSGETAPSDRDLRLALVAARRAWLYPVPVDAPEVLELKDLASTLRTSGKTESVIQKALCRASLESPLFWLGFPAEKFWVTRMTLELGLRLPTQAEYEEAFAGTLTPEKLAEKLQSESAYMSVVQRWHRDWLGFAISGDSYYADQGETSLKKEQQLPPFEENGGATHSTGFGGVKMTLAQHPIYDGSGSVIDANAVLLIPFASKHLSGFNSSTAGDIYGPPENCLPIQQDFDPSTGRIAIEFWKAGSGSTSGAWQTLAAHVRDTNYLDDLRIDDGSYDAPDGSSLTFESFGSSTFRPDTTASLSVSEKAYPDFTFGKTNQSWASRITFPVLKGNSSFVVRKYRPVTPFTSHPDFWLHPFGWRVRRYAAAASTTEGEWGEEQYGMSKIKLPWSRQEVWVCNAFSRIVSSCAYVPRDGKGIAGESNGYSAVSTFSAKNLLKSDHEERLGFSDTTRWTPINSYDSVDKAPAVGTEGLKAAFLGGLSGAPRDDGWNVRPDRTFSHGAAIANLRVLDSFYCGTPNTALLSPSDPSHSPIGLKNTVFPKGSKGSVQDVAVNIKLTVDSNVASGLENHPEISVIRSIGEDLSLEPARLIEHIVDGNRDYRELLTATYTFGRKPLSYYFLTQAYYLPGSPAGAKYQPTDTDFRNSSVLQLNFTDFPSFSRLWIQDWRQNIDGQQNAQNLHYFRTTSTAQSYNLLKEITPRPMAGILTQHAFINPVSPKIRSLVSRIYSRLMCSNPAALELTDSQQSEHETYIYSKSHLRSDCVTCHRHVDPLARAISHGFGLDTTNESDIESVNGSTIGEMLGFRTNPSLTQWHWGVRGTSALPHYAFTNSDGNTSTRGQGMFMGEKVSGMREIGQKIANRREFARCVTVNTLRGLYGREETLEDLSMVEKATDEFMSHYNYNALVRYLASQPHFYSVQ